MATVDLKTFENSLPDSLKSTGSEKLGQIILEKGIQISDLIQPQLTKLLSSLTTPDGLCLPEAQLNLLIAQRNNIVDNLNQIEKYLNLTTKAVGITSTTLNVLITTAKVLRGLKPAAIAAISAATPLPGPFASLVLQINEVLDSLKFDALGNSKLNKLKIIIDSTATPISLTSQFIAKAITLLGLIDIIIKKCSPNSTLSSISQDLINITEAQLKASQTLNDITYKGFIIEIQEIPFSPTVNRRKAVGKNAQGIPLIETELSFTTISQILVNELKLIIDRDNLKAY
jgi:hypothetical protein